MNGVAWWLGGNPYFGTRVGFSTIRDGTSNTAAFSEWIKGKAGQNAPGLNLVYAIAQFNNGGPQNDISRLPGREHAALGLQGRILDAPGHRPRRPLLPRHAPEQVLLQCLGRLRGHRLVHRRQLIPPRRHERPAHGRLGPVRQGRHRPRRSGTPWEPGPAARSSAPMRSETNPSRLGPITAPARRARPGVERLLPCPVGRDRANPELPGWSGD